MTESHISLRDDYEVSAVELDAAVACVTIGVLGSVAWDRGGRPLILCILAIIGFQAAANALARVGGDPISAATRPLPVE